MNQVIENEEPNKLYSLAERMQSVAEKVYWLFFQTGMGAEAHAFIEFNGLISKYVQLCYRAADKGIDFRFSNVHSSDAGLADVAEEHDIEYLAEKLECIFAPFLKKPKLRKILLEKLSGTDQG